MILGQTGNESAHFGCCGLIKVCNLISREGSVGPSRNRAFTVLFIIMNVVVIVVEPFVGNIGSELGKRVELTVGNGGAVVLIGGGVTIAGLVVVGNGTVVAGTVTVGIGIVVAGTVRVVTACVVTACDKIA